MNISIERATPADVENLVKAQIAAFHHDSVMYPGVEIGGPPGYDSVEQMREKIPAPFYDALAARVANPAVEDLDI